MAVLSELVARRSWGDDDPIGRRVRLNSDRPDSPWVTIVGIVGDVKNPTADHWQPTAYRPFAQVPSAGAVLMIRAAVADPQSLAAAVRRELHAIDPAAPELRMAILQTAVRDYASQQRFTTILLAAFALIGLALATAGVYGVMRYWVASRTGEIGIRMALGAQGGEVLRLVLGRAARAAAVGVAAGVAGAIALRKVIATQLIAVNPVDPVVLAAVSAVIFAVAVLAAWAPARRAAGRSGGSATRGISVRSPLDAEPREVLIVRSYPPFPHLTTPLRDSVLHRQRHRRSERPMLLQCGHHLGDPRP